mmetsp:Transcript_21839/g.60688  ORF Transcript_21839/g.60688 Transcript_21839/m.60688 type:complete len:407 (-) Transcript_21839:92-1312(-)
MVQSSITCHKIKIKRIHAPQYLNGLVAAHGGGLRGCEFCHGGLSREYLPRVLELRRSPCQQPGLVSRQHHLADLVLDHLKVGNGLVEGLSLEGVLDGAIDRCGGNAQGLPCDAYPSPIQCGHGNLKSLPLLSEQVFPWNADVVQDDVGRGRRTNAEFVFLGTQTVAFGTSGNDKGGNALVLETLVGGRKDHRRIGFVGIGDPGLGSVDDPVVPILGGGSGRGSRIGSVSGLAQTKATNVVYLSVPVVGRKGKGRDKFLVLLGRPKGLDRVHVERVVGAHDDPHRGAAPRNFLHGNGVREGVEAAAAVLLGGVDSHQSQLGQGSDGLGRELVFLVPLAGVGRQFLVGEFSAHFVDHARLLRQLGVTGDRSGSDGRRRGSRISGVSGCCEDRTASARNGSCDPRKHHG